jgi:hypothetical protein
MTLTSRAAAAAVACLGSAGPLSPGVVLECRQALRILHIRGAEVRRKSPRGGQVTPLNQV